MAPNPKQSPTQPLPERHPNVISVPFSRNKGQRASPGAVTVRRVKVRKAERWMVYQGRGKPRSFHDTQKAAEAEADRIRGEIARDGKAWVGMPAEQKSEVLAVVREVLKSGASIRHVWEEYRRAPNHTATTLLLQTIIDEYLELKERAGKVREYVATVRCALKAFVKSVGNVPIGQVTVKNIEAHLGALTVANRPTIRARISGLFKFAMRREYIAKNPCAMLDPLTHPPTIQPRIFTPKEIETCLEWFKTHPKAFPWFVLSTFCGLRPEEADKTTKADIHIKEGWLKVEAQTTKVRQRRVVYPRPEALHLLAIAMKRGRMPMAKVTRQRAMMGLRAKLKLKAWPKDATRHSCATYWLADGNDAANVAHMLGHSESVLKRHYAALATKDAAAKFWQMAAKVKF